MIRKLLATLIGLVTFLSSGLLSACANIDDEIEELSQWTATQPALRELSAKQQLAGGIPANAVYVKGPIRVASVPEFFAALSQLHAKAEEIAGAGDLDLELDVTTVVSGTEFNLRSYDWDAQQEAETYTAIFEPFASPPAARVHIDNRIDGLEAWADRDEKVSDDEARAHRDVIFQHLDDMDIEGRFRLNGFPLVHPARPEGVNFSTVPAPILDLNGFPQGYTEATSFAEKVDATTDFELRSVRGDAGMDEWEFYTEGEFDEAALKAIKKVLSDPAAGDRVSVRISGPEGGLGRALIGIPLEQQPDHVGPWTERMRQILSA